MPETHVFVDDYTGTSMNRPQFKQLRDLVQQRLVQAVIVHDLDRLSRKRQQYERRLTQCDKDLKRWEAAYLGEAIDLADFKAKKAEVDARRASAEQELARLDAEQRLIEQVELETASLMEYCARVRLGIATLHPGREAAGIGGVEHHRGVASREAARDSRQYSCCDCV